MWNFMRICFMVAACLANASLPYMIAPIYWNSTNTLFKSSSSFASIEARLYYQIDLICPYYDEEYVGHMETYTIYQVSKEEYDACELKNGSFMLVNCSTPSKKRRSTLMFLQFQPIPNAPAYTEGKTYYVITTSTGNEDGLSNKVNGACLTHNMKVSFYIQPNTATKTQDVQTPGSRSETDHPYSRTVPNRSFVSTATTKPARKTISQTYSVNTLQHTQTNSKQFQNTGQKNTASFNSFEVSSTSKALILRILLTAVIFYFFRTWS